MKIGFHHKSQPLNDKSNLSLKHNKKQLKNLINSLIKRREEHQAQIAKLVGIPLSPQIPSKEQSQPKSTSQFSQLLEQLDNNEGIQINAPHQSVKAFGSHVNLLATVSLKTQYFLAQKKEKQDHGMLLPSLKDNFGQYKRAQTFFFCDNFKGISEGWKQTVDYLRQMEMEADLFTRQAGQLGQEQSEFMGTRFNLGKYQEIQLSKAQLKQEQSSLILIEEDKCIDLGWLLLRRLLNETKADSFPQILHTLFSYPVKTFNIRNSLELIQFTQVLKQLTKSQQERQEEGELGLKVLGVDSSTGYSYEIDHLPKNANLKYYTTLLHRFSKLAILQQQQLSVKHIPLSCLQNHFVVVTMNVPTKGEYYISLGSQNFYKKYRIFLLNSQDHLVQTALINSGQFIFSKLKAEQYEIYVHPVAQMDLNFKDLEQSYELVTEHQDNFSLWVQGKDVYSKNGELSLQIRLKQEYNQYTMKIALNYLKNNVQSQQQQIQLSEEKPQIIIKRQHIGPLNLVLDTLLTTQSSPLTITYKGQYMLADNLFQVNEVNLGNQKNVVLYKPAEIQKVVFRHHGNVKNVEFRVVETHL